MRNRLNLSLTILTLGLLCCSNLSGFCGALRGGFKMDGKRIGVELPDGKQMPSFSEDEGFRSTAVRCEYGLISITSKRPGFGGGEGFYLLADSHKCPLKISLGKDFLIVEEDSNGVFTVTGEQDVLTVNGLPRCLAIHGLQGNLTIHPNETGGVINEEIYVKGVRIKGKKDDLDFYVNKDGFLIKGPDRGLNIGGKQNSLEIKTEQRVYTITDKEGILTICGEQSKQSLSVGLPGGRHPLKLFG